ALRAEGRAIADPEITVLAEGAAAWGVNEILRRVNGAFAGALWDREQRRLHLFRDRYGARPLYCAETNGLCLFASELKGLRASPYLTAQLDLDSLAAYLRWRSVPTPNAIYRGVRQPSPGTSLILSTGGDARIETFWSMEEAATAGLANPFAGSESEAVDYIDRMLCEAVRQRLGSTPTGVFLSAGIDSPLLLALAKDMAATPPIAFTVGYHEDKYSEAGGAEAIARHVGAEQHTLYVTSDMAADAIPCLPDIFDEPN